MTQAIEIQGLTVQVGNQVLNVFIVQAEDGQSIEGDLVGKGRRAAHPHPARLPYRLCQADA